ncbi:MAG: pseudouridine synthase RluD [Actinomycetota bacterium]|jgi:23S rRNA pseudouridine1911/1915/1917 synthase
MIVEETIPAALAGERLDRVVSLIADISRSEARELVAAGGARVDGVDAPNGKVRLTEGQVVLVDLDKIPVAELPQPDPDVPVEVLYEDEHVIVINKPVGLVVHPAAGHGTGTLVNGLLVRYPEISSVGQPLRPGIVHRLDAGTSGLMVVARSQAAYDALVEAMSDHDVEREYMALAWGHFDSANGVIDAAIGRDPRDPLKMAVVRDGKWARTHFEVIEEFVDPAELSLVQCTLETGRTHQIRVHLAAVGHAVVGDSTYGGSRSSLKSPRPMLHAARLAFAHPVTGEHMEFGAGMPADMVGIIAQCSAVADE